MFVSTAASILTNRAELKSIFGLTKSDRTPTKKLARRYVTELCSITVPVTPEPLPTITEPELIMNTTTTTTSTTSVPATIVLLVLLTMLAVLWDAVVIPVLRFTFNHTIRGIKAARKALVPHLMNLGLVDYRAIR
jgi:hypothetical protein